MIQVTFHDLSEVDDRLFLFAVIAARYRGKWLLCQHRDRNTLEIPGGTREPDEAIEETARRELWEESGALDYALQPVCAYRVLRSGSDTVSRPGFHNDSWGVLFTAEITALDPLPPCSEMESIHLFENISAVSAWTHPQIQPRLLEHLRTETLFGRNTTKGSQASL